jgi:predicted CXXCH cytochrome family protein
MRQKLIVALLACAVFICIVIYSMQTEPHKFQECLSCHLTDAAGKILEHEMTAPITTLCARCHEKILTEGYQHPVDTRPQSIRVPADMPLSPHGEITCSTCHDIHASYFTPYDTPSHYLRRYETGKDFCRTCHTGAGNGKRGHTTSLGESHFLSKYIVTDPSLGIDPMSKNCISCHDGAYASSVTIKAGTWSHGRDFIRHDQGSHPIGVLYEAARRKEGSKTDLKPMAMVDRRIRFFDGKVGCGSCHDPYSTIEKRLVMSDQRSELCLACHIM